MMGAANDPALDQKLEDAKANCRAIAAQLAKRDELLSKLSKARDAFKAHRTTHEQASEVARINYSHERDAWLLAALDGPEPRLHEPKVAGSPFENLAAAKEAEAEANADIARTQGIIAGLRAELGNAERELDRVVDAIVRAQAAARRPEILKAIEDLKRIGRDYPLEDDIHKPVNRLALSDEEATINRLLLAAYAPADPWNTPLGTPGPFEKSAARQAEIRRSLRAY